MRKIRGDTLIVGGRKYHYSHHAYLLTFQNERAVEIPLAYECLQEYQGKKILEVGNVLSYYYPVYHDIVDKYETADWVINEDIVDFSSPHKYDLIICISTLEHIGWDAPEEKDETKTLRTVNKFRTLLGKGGTAVVTFPVGYNPYLDTLLKEGRIRFDETYGLKRISWDNRWVEVSIEEAMKMKYGYPFKAVNGLIIGKLRK
ncbi:hypothetical protein H0N98_00320 [Candidatus Micrarchaeota archaeon]|nr:hypothetical protein [Candidatus Micrarchaeota archaeon]